MRKETKGANRALNWLLLTGRNTPARLEQIVAKHLLLRVLNIVEYNNQNAINLCYCHKFSGCAPEWRFKFHCREVCQMHTDFHRNIEFYNNFHVFVKVVRDIFSRRDRILQQIISSSTLFNLKYKQYLSSDFNCFDDILIDEYLLF